MFLIIKCLNSLMFKKLFNHTSIFDLKVITHKQLKVAGLPLMSASLNILLFHLKNTG